MENSEIKTNIIDDNMKKTYLKGCIVIPSIWWDEKIQQWLEWIPWDEI